MDLDSLNQELNRLDKTIQDIFTHNPTTDGIRSQHEYLRDLTEARKSVMETIKLIKAE